MDYHVEKFDAAWRRELSPAGHGTSTVDRYGINSISLSPEPADHA